MIPFQRFRPSFLFICCLLSASLLVFQGQANADTIDPTCLDAEPPHQQKKKVFFGVTVSGMNDMSATSTTVSIASSTNVQCNGGSDGSITATASGGTSPYTYSWSNGGFGATISGLSAGTYTVTVRDNTGTLALNTASRTITEPTQLLAFAVVNNNVSCNGFSDGSAVASATGGTGAYTYVWNTGATSASINSLPVGTYTVTVTDNNGCMEVASATITEPTSVIASAVVDNNVSCNGVSDGAATASATGGTGAYTYAWSNGATSASNTGLPAGTFTVTISDNNGCTNSASATITEPTQLMASATVSSNVSCNGDSDGAATASATGGTGAYTYTWSNGATSASNTGLPAGTFTVTVTDNNGCTNSASTTITEPSAIDLSNINLNNVSCNGDSNGSISVGASGGTPAYTYAWSTGATNATISGLTAGVYTLTLTDANSCTAASNYTISEPSAIIVTGTTSEVSCNGNSDGSISVSVSGGTPAYTYVWSNGATTSNITGLVAGTYTITVTDANTCTATESYTVDEPSAISISDTVSDVLCNGGTDGSISLSVSGGTALYTYLWSNGAVTANNTGLAAGTYTVTVTDNNGCIETDSYTVAEPAAINISFSTIDATCGLCNGSINLTVTGGVGNYTYTWSDPNLNGLQNPTNLCAGSYQVTVVDDNGCAETISIDVATPPALTVTVTTSDVTCFGECDGFAVANVQGGTSPYSFSWNDPMNSNIMDPTGLCVGTYTVTVTDNDGCTAIASGTIAEPADLVVNITSTDETASSANDGTATATATGGTGTYSYLWSNAATTAAITGLTPGAYTVTVTDANGCTESATTSISPFNCNINLSINSQDVLCNGGADGSATAVVSGGVGALNYLWSNGGTTATINGLNAGTYTATVTDGDNCSAVSSVDITEPAAIQLTAVVTDASCAGGCDGVIDLTVTGGTSPYVYNWSNADTRQDPNGLCAGTYTVTVTDANNCTAVLSEIVGSPMPLDLVMSSTNVTMSGGSDGTATVTVTGGTAGYDYVWSNGATTQTATGLAEGQYCVTVTDDRGCTEVGCTTVDGINCNNLNTTFSLGMISCNGGNDGTATATLMNGVRPLTYNWSSGNSMDSVLTGLSAGNYTLTITDAVGCEDTTSFTITEPPVFTVFVMTTNESSSGANDGTAVANASGGTGTYQYVWNNNATTDSIGGLSAGTYCVTVTDENNCSATSCGAVDTTTCNLMVTVSTVNVSCNGGDDGSATLSITGATMPTTVVWSSGDGTNLTAGNYTVTVTDAANCEVIENFTITEPPLLVVTLTESGENLCFGDCNINVDANVQGGTQPYAYDWSNGSTTPNLDSLCSGTYTLTVTDSNGCSAMATLVVATPSQLDLSTSSTNETSQGANNGTATVAVTGGTPAYTYLWTNSATTASISDLAPGQYCVTVTDANGCSEEACVNVASGTCMLIATAPADNFTCPNTCEGSVAVSVSNGVMPYAYTWSNSAIGDTSVATGLCVGTYTVTVTDAVNCTTELIISVNDGVPMMVEAAVTPETCAGSCDAQVNITVIGGTPPYSFDGLPIMDVCEGSYNFEVIDANGCRVQASFDVISPPELILAVDSVMDATTGQSDGSIEVSVSGGVMPYTYSWSLNGTVVSIAEDPSGLATGTYDLVLTDANGCQIVDSVVVDEVTSIRPLGATDEIQFLPNPVTQGLAYLRFDLSAQSPIDLELYDLNGRLVQKNRQEAIQKGEIILDLHYLTPGIYSLVIHGDQFSYVQKVVVIKE